MPELPDVQVFREYVDATSLHVPIVAVHVDAEHELDGVSARSVAATLRNRTLEGTARHGKHLFIALGGSPARWLRLHFGMTGGLRAWSGEGGPDPAHVRLRIGLEGGRKLAYLCTRRLGAIGLVESPDETIEELELGPDPLEDDVGRDRFGEILGAHSGRIKTTLMDQKVLAGLGNVYTDEILFQAGVPPEARIPDLDSTVMQEIHRVMRRVLRKAIRVRVDPERMPRRWLLPRRDDGRACPRCDGQILKVEVGGRPTFVCDRHQGVRPS